MAKWRLPGCMTRTPKPRKSWMRPRVDPQQALLYTAERWMIGSTIYTRTDRRMLETVIEHACKAAKVTEKPKLRYFRNKRGPFGQCTETTIRLNAHPECRGDNLATLLHELAHWIIDHHPKFDNPQDHGREFVTVYRWLLDKYRVVPAEGFDAICEREGARRLGLDETPSEFQVPVYD